MVAKADAVWQMSLLQQMKRIGLKFKDELNKYRSQIEALEDSPQAGMSDVVKNIIDFLEGRRYLIPLRILLYYHNCSKYENKHLNKSNLSQL